MYSVVTPVKPNISIPTLTDTKKICLAPCCVELIINSYLCLKFRFPSIFLIYFTPYTLNLELYFFSKNPTFSLVSPYGNSTEGKEADLWGSLLSVSTGCCPAIWPAKSPSIPVVFSLLNWMASQFQQKFQQVCSQSVSRVFLPFLAGKLLFFI